MLAPAHVQEIREKQASLLHELDSLAQDPQLRPGVTALVARLRQSLAQHFGLVAAVLDAASEDTPP